jgi:hypothetical protein
MWPLRMLSVSDTMWRCYGLSSDLGEMFIYKPLPLCW